MKTILSTVRREDTNRKKSNEQLEKKLLAVVKKENDALCERMSSLQRIADIDSTVGRRGGDIAQPILGSTKGGRWGMEAHSSPVKN